MMITSKRFAVGIGATAVALLVVGAGAKDISAQGPGFGASRDAQFGQGAPGGPGGPAGRRGGPGGPMGPGLLGPMALGQLDLTADQRNRVQQIMQSHRDEQRALAERAMKAHEALQDATELGSFDESAVRARAAEVANVDADMAVARARIFSEVYQILTPEQQTKLRTIQDRRQQRQERLQERRQNRGARGQR